MDVIISQSEYMKNDLVQNFNIKPGKIYIIHNPVNTEDIVVKAQSNKSFFDNSKINLVAVGRLEKIKGYDRMIDAFSKLKKASNYHLHIFGEGSERKHVEKQITDIHLNNAITLHGFTDNPYQYIKQADLFLIASYSEGFPNVVLEANALGKFVK